MTRDRDPGVPLSHYLDKHAGIAVRFTCTSCMLHRDVPVLAVVARLEARGIGSAETGVREVGRLSNAPCSRCGKVRWETTPGFRVGGPD